MNRLVLIGNGFDLAHGLKTSYKDFIIWYFDKRIDGWSGNTTKLSEDCLCKMTIKAGSGLSCWNVFAFNNSYFRDIRGKKTRSGYDVIKEVQNYPDAFSIDFTPFFGTILQSLETKGWVDIENDYYQLLKRCTENVNCGYTVKELNEQLAYLQEKLVEYLTTVNQQDISIKQEIYKKIYASIDPKEVSVEGKVVLKSIDERWKKMKQDELENIKEELLSRYGITEYLTKRDYLEEVKNYIEDPLHYKEYPRLFMLPDNIMLLNFNYTRTVSLYHNPNFMLNHIHGKLEKPDSVIFGYGDELDENYKKIQNLNNNEYLKNVKSIRYLESDNYRNVLEFIESAPYQICIMGHSCGNSDRTLLNTLFEHKNCISIKPYFYEKEDGSNNYLELVQNISRNFTDMKLMRDRVVNKTYCEPLVKRETGK